MKICWPLTWTFLLCSAGLGSACSGDATTPVIANGGAGGGSHAGAMGAPGGSANEGGLPTAGASGSGSAGASASGATGIAGGSAAAGGGASGAVPSGGAFGDAPSGGTSGASGAGGGAGSNGNDDQAAAVLNGFKLLDPCQSTYKAIAASGDVCPQDNAVKNQKISLQFGGDAAITYNVTLHVRGVMEGYWYSGGTLDPKSKTFYAGGVPTIGGYNSACKNKTSELPFTLPAEVTPSDNCWNGFNMFALTVSAPKEHYYLNYTADKNDDRPPHAVYKSDYTVTVAIQGQAKLEFYIVGSDEHQCYNFNQIISGVSTTPNPYIGEFVQFDVTSVTRAQ